MTYTRLNPQTRLENVSGWVVNRRIDGITECWTSRHVTVASGGWSQWGSVYEAQICSEQDLPVTFAEKPNRRVELYQLDGSPISGFEFGNISNANTKFPKVWAWRANQSNTSITIGVTLFAWGRV